MSTGAITAYSEAAAAWQQGPARIYDRLAAVLVERSPVPVRGGRVLDVGAGTGAATRAALAAGAASVVAMDAAVGMLAHRATERPPAVAGDARRLPFAGATFDAAVAAFSLNHLTDPAGGLREMARVVRSGGALVAGSYAADDDHPVKAAVEAALAAYGWEPDPWYVVVRTEIAPRVATVDRFLAAADAAGLDATCDHVRITFPELGTAELVEWRLGLAQHAPFVAGLGPGERGRVAAEASARLANAPTLVRSVLVLRAVRS